MSLMSISSVTEGLYLNHMCTRNLNGRTEVTRRLRHTRNKPDYNVNPQKGMRDRGSLKLSQGHKL
jgi:hypothetical protein